MLNTTTWWKEIFSGELSIGLNEQKIHQLNDESFLYLTNKQEQLPVNEQYDEEHI